MNTESVPNTSIVVYNTPDKAINISLDLNNRTIWITQRQIAEALNLDVRTISEHVGNFKADHGERAKRVIRNFRITASDGKNYRVEHYDMTVVAYIGFRAQASERVMAFQDWVGEILNRYLLGVQQQPLFSVDEYPVIEKTKGYDARQMKQYRRLLASGYTTQEAVSWLQVDESARHSRKEVTAEWHKRDGNIPKLTNYVTQQALGKTATQLKAELGVSTNLRDELSVMDKGVIAVTEMMAKVLHVARATNGNNGLLRDVREASGFIDKDKIAQALTDKPVKQFSKSKQNNLLTDGET